MALLLKKGSGSTKKREIELQYQEGNKRKMIPHTEKGSGHTRDIEREWRKEEEKKERKEEQRK